LFALSKFFNDMSKSFFKKLFITNSLSLIAKSIFELILGKRFSVASELRHIILEIVSAKVK